ncbi:DUF397 domain-containing protein [Streptomyces coelicoflavus]|uniref:DUF397 domain-containing protein n=1 Tax=Streptomyces coelicoflavus TaxID=285562 RepID=UPI0006B907B6|nr:hypothetical protein ADL35_13145 [Streptomyces sp. NRRL WC-3753]
MSLALQTASNRVWFKSSYSGGNATECVECAYAPPRTLIRDSKCADGPILSVDAEAWRHFINSLHRS